MAKITKFSLHHSGGLGTDRFAPTQHLTFDQLNAAHRDRWPDFPSLIDPSIFIGYNAVVFPDGKVIQTRFIGEETCAVKGYNRETFSLLALGNFNKMPDGRAVEVMTAQQKIVAENMAKAFADANPERMGLQKLFGTIIDIKLIDFGPHRFWASTDCYGTSISDDYLRAVIRSHLNIKLSILQQIVLALQKLLSLMPKVRFGSMPRGTASCLDEDTRG